MNIQGLNKVTLLDFPGHVAATVFTGGCDLRCPFCHNSQLVLKPSFSPIDENAVFELLKKRKGILEGVAVTGGEPLLQADIKDFLSRVKELGYPVKLDTNGTHPDRLEDLISLGLVDYVAMDIKNSADRYAETVGVPNFNIEPIKACAKLLISGMVDYEFRTTVVAELHNDESFIGIKELIDGADKYFLQGFVDSGAIIGKCLHAAKNEDMKRYADIARGYVSCVELRGI